MVTLNFPKPTSGQNISLLQESRWSDQEKPKLGHLSQLTGIKEYEQYIGI